MFDILTFSVSSPRVHACQAHHSSSSPMHVKPIIQAARLCRRQEGCETLAAELNPSLASASAAVENERYVEWHLSIATRYTRTEDGPINILLTSDQNSCPQQPLWRGRGSESGPVVQPLRQVQFLWKIGDYEITSKGQAERVPVLRSLHPPGLKVGHVLTSCRAWWGTWF
ncbi:hypothetical protein BaRGS_00036591 [Batillaria attramentaria]|uniref:Uncharacterized protein n=1 Tax=Batillaria attramentaria TaxID=370345 RepID=A0ABD0JBL1_9CAEN